MSGSSDYTQTPNLGLYKPTYNADAEQWGNHLNSNADRLDTAIGTGGPFLPLTGGTVTGPLNYIATGGNTSRSAQDRAAQVLYAEDYGVVRDAADNTTALQAFFAALQSFPGAARGVLPSGVIRFTTPINALNGRMSFALVGSGVGSTWLYYTGADTTVDLLTLTNCSNFSLEGFRIDSQTVMTAGTGLLLQDCAAGCLTQIRAAGQAGATHIGSDSNMHYNLWNGFWFNRVSQVTLFNFEAAAQNDAIRLNGGVGPSLKAGLFLQFGKVMGALVGLHVGGAFGGIYVDNTDIIGNWNNIVVDQAIAAEVNREVLFGANLSCDSSGVPGTPTIPGSVNPGGGAIGDNIWINDPGGGFLIIKGWVASTASGGHCIHISAWQGPVHVDGCTVAFANGGCDGVRIDTDTPTVIITPGTSFTGITGYAVNKTTGTGTVWGASVVTAPGPGYLEHDISPTTNMQLKVASLASVGPAYFGAGVNFLNGALAIGDRCFRRD